MRYALLMAAVLAAGCSPESRPDPDEPVEKRKPALADYRRTADAILDSIAALAERHASLQGLAIPPNSRADGLHVVLAHRGDDLTLDAVLTLHDDPAGAFRVGDLRVAIVAGGLRGADVHDAIFEAIAPALRAFNEEFEP